VLAEFGTTKRMTFDGKGCARADVNAAAPTPSAAAPVRNARLFMAFSHLVGLPAFHGAALRSTIRLAQVVFRE
jgi:hypothetical protein